MEENLIKGEKKRILCFRCQTPTRGHLHMFHKLLKVGSVKK
jgi:hypothetical protein